MKSDGRTTPNFSAFERLLVTSKNQFGVSLLLLLSWIATCDGDTSSDELEALSEIGGKSFDAESIKRILQIAQQEDLAAIQLACEIIRADTSQEATQSFYSLMISIAVADGYLRPSENHVLRLYSDILGISTTAMDAIFQDVTGKPFPAAPDLSSAAWWKSRGHDNRKQQSRTSKEQETSSRQFSMKHLKALGILGLDEGATEVEIKSAFRRLAQVHHPDRFTTLGEEAMRAASASFRRIKEAHDYLMTNA